ncbi:ankyrin repeat domain-containing protein [Cardinium endosymbiont of Tipula unca]|uniref:ankyrin repeat domain-containing protein n=1 Tax=Cardinium endosymbiont of Tipula unca TaxID=3066216 RepID=UPI0030D1A75A
MLFCSIKGANRGYIQVLLATSRNRIYFRRRSIDVNMVDENGYTPLSLAVEKNNIDIVKILINKTDIDVNKGDGIAACFPLYLAAFDHNLEMVQVLLKAPGININPTFRT